MSETSSIALPVAVWKAGDYSVERYTPDRKPEWDAFLRKARNATFLFQRDYMDYHSDRYEDYSLLVFHGKTLMALLPANLDADGTLASHNGLTYGGLVVARPATLRKVMTCFHAVLNYLRKHGIKKLFYKEISSIYGTLSNDDMALVFFLLKAQHCHRDVVLAINQADRLPFRKGRKSEISKAHRFGVRLEQETDFAPFWEQVLIPHLKKQYWATPVHSLDEIKLLASRFPENIKQFSAYIDGEIVAGTTIFETPNVAHTQYIGATEKGRHVGALDCLIAWLITEQYGNKKYFDFGSCNQSDRLTLSMGLLRWKEGFGGRCYSHDFYEIATDNYTKLEPVLCGE